MNQKEITDWFNNVQANADFWEKMHAYDQILDEVNTPSDILLRIENEIDTREESQRIQMSKLYNITKERIKNHSNYKNLTDILEDLFDL